MKKVLCMCMVVVLMLSSLLSVGAFVDNASVAEEFKTPKQLLFNDFEALSSIPEGFDGASGVLSVEEGLLKVTTNGSDWYPKLISPSVAVEDKPIVIEFNQVEGDNVYGAEFGICPAGGNWMSVKPTSTAGIKYVIYNPTEGSYTLYESDWSNGIEKTGLASDPGSFNFRSEPGAVYSGRYLGWDYVAVYEYTDFALKLEDVTTSGAKLKTTAPIDVSSSLSVDGKAVTIKKVGNTYNTYDITFGDELDGLSRYTLSGSIKYLGAADSVAVTEEFETPKCVYETPKQYLFNDFEGLSSAPSGFDGGSGILSVEDGILKVTTNGSDWYPRLISPSVAVEDKPIVIEFNQVEGDNVYGAEFGICPAGGNWMSVKPTSTAGIKYVIYNPTEGSYTLYESDWSNGIEKTGLASNPGSFQFRSEPGTVYSGRYLAWDYVAVYACKSFSYELTAVTTEGAILKTTRPISLDSVLKVGDTPVEITKVSNKYNEYAVKFADELIGETNYSISGSVNYLGGDALTDLYVEFTTPKRAFEFKNLSVQNVSGEVKTVINAANNTNKDKVIYLTVAAYENGGAKLAGVKMKTVTIPANSEPQDYFTDALSVSGNGITYKGFAWDMQLIPVNLILAE